MANKGKYICRVESRDFCGDYYVDTKSAMKCALEYGRCGADERVSVFYKSGKHISTVRWSPEDGGHYYRVNY